MAGLPFIKEDGDRAVVDCHSLDVLVPESFFQDPPIAEDMGGSVSTLCFVQFRTRDAEGSQPRLWSVRVPARMSLRYSSKSEEAGEDGESSRVFSLSRGEVLIDSLSIVKSAENVTEVFRAVIGARLDGVGYEDVIGLFVGSSALNGTNLGVSRPVLEAMVAEMTRYSKDPSLPFRVPLVKGKAGPADFEFAKLKELPRRNSVFTGLSFEDITLAVQSGVRKTMNGERQNISPVEEVIKY